MGTIKKMAKRAQAICLGIVLFGLLGGIACQQPDEPTKADYLGYWEVKRLGPETDTNECSVGDIYEIVDDTLNQYHFDSSDTPRIVADFGTHFVQKKMYLIQWDDNASSFHIRNFFYMHYFELKNGELEENAGVEIEQRSISKRLIGTFPKEEWQKYWPPKWIINRRS